MGTRKRSDKLHSQIRAAGRPTEDHSDPYRVCIVNLSKIKSAIDVEVERTNLIPPVMACVPCHLRLKNNILPAQAPIEKFTLTPEGRQFIDVMRWGPTSDKFDIWHTVLQPTEIPAQPYYLTISTAATNAPRISKNFDVFRDGNGWGFRPTGESPLEIIFDPTNPARRFWSMESPVDDAGQRMPGAFWEYRVEIKNNSTMKTLKNVTVTTERLGRMPARPTDQAFDKVKKTSCDIKPQCSELVPVLHWPIPISQAGMLAGPSALEYGPIRVTAGADDVIAFVRTFSFDYQVEPMLFDYCGSKSAAISSPPAASEAVSRSSIGSAEWLDLSDRFKEISRFTRVDLQRIRRGDSKPVDTWTTKGAAEESRKLKALCSRGGAMLIRSPHVVTDLS